MFFFCSVLNTSRIVLLQGKIILYCLPWFWFYNRSIGCKDLIQAHLIQTPKYRLNTNNKTNLKYKFISMIFDIYNKILECKWISSWAKERQMKWGGLKVDAYYSIALTVRRRHGSSMLSVWLAAESIQQYLQDRWSAG